MVLNLPRKCNEKSLRHFRSSSIAKERNCEFVKTCWDEICLLKADILTPAGKKAEDGHGNDKVLKLKNDILL